MSKLDLSIVVPLLNEQESLPELCAWIEKVMRENNFTYEILLIDDGSTDDSWKEINKLSQQNAAIKGIKFRRNYGKSAALNVGFEASNGAVVITMDADLQDSPDEIPELRRMILEEGYHLVSGWKKKRYDPISKTIPTKIFNWATRKMSGVYLHDFNCGLKAYRSAVIKSIEIYGEMHRYIPVIAKWHGFKKIGEKVVQHQERKYGTTKFGLERFINGFLDLMSISFVSKFGKRPMHFFGFLGFLMFSIGLLISFWLGGYKLYMVYNFNKALERSLTELPLFYVALVAMILGTQLFLAGFLAEMIARNSSDRNKYLIEDKIGLN